MTRSWRWSCRVLLLAALCCTGCNIMSWPYFLGYGDTNQPPQMVALASEDKDKETKVVIVAYSGQIADTDFITADRELTGMLTRYLQDVYKENKQKVVIVPSGKVNKYKDTNPNWHLDLEATGKHFNADYLVYLDIESLSLYEHGSNNLLFRGRADVHVSVIDTHKPDETPLIKDYHCEFPKGAPVPIDDRNVQEFRRAFLNDVARHLAWFFTPHSPSSDIGLPE